MISSIDLAQQASLHPIRTFLEPLGLADEDFDFYGQYTGKVRLHTLDKLAHQPDGKLILVTAMTPTRAGEGKTLTSVGLGQAMGQLGKRGMITLREPSLGPVFGIKGGAAGGGYAQVLPMERINLHFNGDLHAITAAHNLLAAMLDNHLHQGNALDLDVREIIWPRALDMNDRALRNIVVGLGGRINSVPRETGFVITAASEIMAILALATSRADLKRRLGNIVVGFSRQGTPVRAADLQAEGAMAVLLNEAIMPNLVQTLEHTPALIHAGPFANIAHGTSSVLAARMALKLADYVVTEAGFAADLGAEKFFNIVCRSAGLWPSAVVVVATCRAIKLHGGAAASALDVPDPEAFSKGLANLRVHVRNMQKFGIPVVVGLNRFPTDTVDEIHEVTSFCTDLGVRCVPHTAFADGGAGATALAETVLALADRANHQEPRYTYTLDQTIEEKIERIACDIYGADGIHIEKSARKQINRFTELGFGQLPICIAKTQASLSDDSSRMGAPTGWTLTVTDVQLAAGAGFLVVVCGNMMRMPGLPKAPAALNMEVDDDGRIHGLF